MNEAGTTIEVITPECQVCHRTGALQAPAEGYKHWVAGESIQYALPDLTADEREMLISGTHPDCFDSLFSDDEDED
jgi:hypothetical protein